MTGNRRDDDQDLTPRADDGDVSADPEALSDAEVQDMGAGPGRGARPEPGAEASDDFVEAHIEGGDAQGPKKDTDVNRGL